MSGGGPAGRWMLPVLSSYSLRRGQGKQGLRERSGEALTWRAARALGPRQGAGFQLTGVSGFVCLRVRAWAVTRVLCVSTRDCVWPVCDPVWLRAPPFPWPQAHSRPLLSEVWSYPRGCPCFPMDTKLPLTASFLPGIIHSPVSPTHSPPPFGVLGSPVGSSPQAMPHGSTLPLPQPCPAPSSSALQLP